MKAYRENERVEIENMKLIRLLRIREDVSGTGKP